VGLEKKSDPASDAAMAASPHMLTAWAVTSRENGEGGRKRGSVAILEGEGTAGACTGTALPRWDLDPGRPGALHPTMDR